MSDHNIALIASVRDRLTNVAKARNQPYQEILYLYGIERFLYRLSISNYCDQFVLKGGLLFEVHQLQNRRFTRDIDFRGYVKNSDKEILKVIKDICSQDADPDGLVFDTTSIELTRINEHVEESGVRVRFIGFLGRSRIHMQIDIGFFDDIYPDAISITFPSLLDMDNPILVGYPQESIISEKFQAMIHLGVINSRMKDFYDIWLLINEYQFEREILQKAIQITFEKRKTVIPIDHPLPFQKEFSIDKQRNWLIFCDQNSDKNVPKSLSIIIEEISGFLMPVCDSINNKREISNVWKPGRGWILTKLY